MKHISLFARHALCLLLLCSFYLPGRGQITGNQPAPLSPGGTMDSVWDMNGNKYPLSSLVTDSISHIAARGVPTLMSTCNSGYFQLYLETGCGMENFASDSNHLARLNVVCQVLSDLSAFINNSACNVTGQKVNIWVRSINSIPGVPSYAAGLATSFYLVPIGSSASGIADNTIWLTLHSGRDAFTHVASPLAVSGTNTNGNTFFHGMMAFNFSAISWNTDLTTAPVVGEYDLYTTVLHEMMHALGFMSEINYDGTSRLGSNYSYFSRYDLNLKSSGGANLLSNSGSSCSLYNYAFNSSLSASSVLAPGCTSGPSTGASNNTVCSTAVTYNGGETTPVPVYTPTCWEGGSSLSHFEDECYAPSGYVLQPPTSNDQYFLMSNASLPGPYDANINPGSMRRYPKPEERQVLADIGYSVNTTFGLSNGSNLNYYNYGVSPSAGITVAGVNDGISDSGSYMFTVAVGGTLPMSGSDLLGNDCGVTGGTFECLETVIGTGTPSITHGSATDPFTYTVPSGSIPGVYLLRYVPVNASGQRGNITYVYVLVTSGNCTPTACNMIPNGGFESAQSCGALNAGTLLPTLDCWSTVSWTPDLYTRGCGGAYDIPAATNVPPADVHPGSDSANNNHFVGLYGAHFPSPDQYVYEGMQASLSSNIVSNTQYTLSFWARTATTGVASPSTASLLCGVSASTLVPWGAFSPATLPNTIIRLAPPFVIPDDNSWHYVTDTFTYTGPSADNFVIINSANLSDSIDGYAYSNYIKYILIDDIQLVPYISCRYTLPDSAYTCDTLTDLGIYLSGCGTVTGATFGGPGVVYDPATGKYIFVPALAGPGTKTLWYTFTDMNGCKQEIYSTIHVANGTGIAIAVAPSATLCPGGTVTLTASGGTVYNWTASAGTVTCSTCATTSATPTGTTTYTVTDQTGSCYSSVSVDIGPVTATISINIPDQAVICPGGTTTLHAAPTGAAYTYQWCLSGVPIPSANGATYSPPTTLTPGNYDYSVIVTKDSACSDTSSITTITVHFLAAPVLSPGSSILLCGNSVQMNASPSTGNYAYHWSFNGSPYGSGYNNPYLNASSSGIYGLSISETTAPFCSSATAYDTTTVSTGPTASITASGPTTLCGGTTPTVLSTNTGTGYTYQWYKNTVAVPTGGTGSSYAPAASGSYTVTTTNTSGCSATSAAVVITVNPAPTVSITYSGSTTFCSGDSLVLNANSVTGYTYQWKLNGADISGATGASYTATTTGNYTYTATITATGCTATTPSGVTITVNPTPTATISPSGDVYTCYGTPVTLTANSGTGYTYLWLPFHTGGATYTSDPTGTYAVTVTVTAPGGCSATSATTNLTVFEGTCICTSFPTFPAVITGGTMTAAAFTSGSSYLVLGDITLTGTGTIKNVYITMGLGTNIYIDPSASITIDSTHIFNCGHSQLWGGIHLMNGVSSTGNLFIRNKSLIEDADTAVSIIAPYHPGGNIFTCDSSIFNANNVGISIINDNALSPYPYRIRNTVFTCRDGISTAYNQWVSVADLKAPGTGNSYQAPYALNNKATYLPITCPFGYTSSAGIFLNGVGTTFSAGNYSTLSIGSVETGAATQDMNLFDGMAWGIYAVNTNVSIYNCTFMNMYRSGSSTVLGGSGIGAKATDGVAYVLSVTPNIDITTTNYFYDCHTSAVEVHNYFDVDCRHVQIMSNQKLSVPDSQCRYGLDIQTTSKYHRVELNDNNMSNITNGIFSSTGATNAGVAQTVAAMGIRNNTIQVAPLSGGTYNSDRFVTIGIDAQTMLSTVLPGTVNINHNTITDVFNGIVLNGFVSINNQVVGWAVMQNTQLTSAGNTISLRQLGSTPSTAQYGIATTNCSFANVSDNNVNLAGTATNDSMRAIYTAGSLGTISQCNVESGTGRGFEFEGLQTYTQWFPGNTMEDNGKGLVISDGYITQQGFLNQPIGNEWLGTNWSLTNLQTYINNSLPTGSTSSFSVSQFCGSMLYVNSGSTTDPTISNGSFSSLPVYSYANGHGIYPTGGTPVSCSPTPFIVKPPVSPYIEPIAQNQVEYGQLNNSNQWINQYNAWQYLDHIDSTLVDSSYILADFYAEAQTGPYAQLTKIEKALANNDLPTAHALIGHGLIMIGSWPDYYYTPDYYYVYMSDNDSNNYIMLNYFTYYNLYISYLDSSLTADDTANIAYLAGLCPVTNGNVVYQARALYALVNGPAIWTDDNCSTPVEGGRHTNNNNNNNNTPAPSIQDAINKQQKYRLYPNPSDGNINIQQAVMDDKPVQAEVWNNEGKSIFSGNLLFSGGVTSIDMRGITPGLYLLHLRDSNGNSYTLKFIVNYK